MFQEMVRIRWNDMEGKYVGGPGVAAQAVKTVPGRPGART